MSIVVVVLVVTVRRGCDEFPAFPWSAGYLGILAHPRFPTSCRINFLYFMHSPFPTQEHQPASVGGTVPSAWPRGTRAESDPKVTGSHRSLNYFHRHRRRRRTRPNPPCSPAPGHDDQRMNTQPSRIEHPSSLSTDEKNGDGSKRLCDH